MLDDGFIVMTYANEQEQIERLYSLIRYNYRKRQAEDIIKTFEDVFDSHKDPEERQNILDYWTELYQAEKYHKIMQRRRPTHEERIIPCMACGYSVSHRHHLWDIATHGENRVTLRLCGNCHELHHLFYNTLAKDSEYSRKLALHVLFSLRVSLWTAQKLLDWCRATIQYEADKGWLEPHKTTDRWLEEKLRWSEYLRKAQSSV